MPLVMHASLWNMTSPLTQAIRSSLNFRFNSHVTYCDGFKHLRADKYRGRMGMVSCVSCMSTGRRA